ncbi:hypothetical protein ID866_2218 [Astraeus odoratus]|nr:hypothetical protein ID866_2218 [Astraeus odoratus]
MIAFGTFQSWYSSHELSYLSEFNISWIGSLQLCAFFFMGGPMGRIFDTYGPSPLLTAGTVLLVSSLVLTSVITQYYQYLLVQGVMFGLSVAMLFYASVSSVATHFDEYRATAIGITTAGSGLGGVIYPLMFRSLFSTVGFGWGVRVSAIQSAILGAAAILTVTTRPELVDKPPRSLIDTSLATDRRFLLLVVGSFFVCFGTYSSL